MAQRKTYLVSDGLLLNYQSFLETPANKIHSLTTNSALLCYLLVREFSLNRQLWFIENAGIQQEITDDEFQFVEDWQEMTLNELSDTLTFEPVIFPVQARVSPQAVNVGQTVSANAIEEINCNGWEIEVGFVDLVASLSSGNLDMVDVEFTFTVDDWKEPRSQCGGVSLVLINSLGQVTATLPAVTNPETISQPVTAAIIRVHSKDEHVLNITRVS